MKNNDFIKGSLTKKSGKEIVITGTHVYNFVAVLALGFLIYELWTWLQSGIRPDDVTLLCLLPAIIGGSYNLIKWVARK